VFDISPINQTGFHWHLIRLILLGELSLCELSISVQGPPPPYFLHLQDNTAWIGLSWTDHTNADHAIGIHTVWIYWIYPQLQFQMRKIISHIWDF